MSEFGLKLLKIFLLTIAALILLASLIEVVIAIKHSGSFANAVGAVFWGMLFRAPGLLIIGTIPISIILAALNKYGFLKWWQVTSVWCLAGILFGGIASIIAGLFVGLLYYFIFQLTEKKNGLDLTKPDSTKDLKPERIKKRGSLFRSLGCIVVFYLLWILVSFSYQTAKGIYVKFVDLPLGNPPFQMQYEHEFNTAMKIALIDFPDEQSCLENGASASLHEDLKRLDWREVDTKSEATVCTFRLLNKYGGISKSDEWLKSQGFRMSDDSFNAAKPYIEPDGTKRVTGYWSIKKSGLKFKKEYALRNLIPVFAYSMSVNATYSEDGEKLLFVRLFFSTL